MEPKELNELNPPQKEAVLHKEGPLLVLAGAGAGKTRVITLRIYNLIKSGVRPGAILAITFTNKAAKEMRDRVFSLIGENSSSGYESYSDDRPFVSTFHSLGVHILRENYKTIGVSKYFNIFDKNDSLKLIKESLIEVGHDPKQISPGKVLSIISRQKGDFVDTKEYEENSENNFFGRVVGSTWRRYEEKLKKENAYDFGDLLLKTAQLFEKNKEIKEYYQKRWEYIHIDEYQDTNKVQYKIASLLAEKSKNIFVVGDVDQNIYSWRGADIRNILGFEKDFENPKIIVLEQNYRSTKKILEASNIIIKKNKNRFEKKLFTENEDGESVGVFASYDEGEEASFIAQKSAELIRKGTSPNEIAVLYRANFQSRNLEEAFLTEEVPYQVLGTRFFERKEIKDVLSFIRASLNPESLSDIKRIINVPPRGIGKITLIKMLSGKNNQMTPAVNKKVVDFKNLLEQIREKSLSKKPSETIKYVISQTGLEKKLKEGTDDDHEKLENIKELVSLGTKYDSLPPEDGIQKLLEEASLASEQDSLDQKTKKNKDGVKLMTIHASKGLEFRYVFVTGLEEGLFPHTAIEDDKRDNEEERRLFYVALTRAKKRVFLTYANQRTIYGNRQVNLPSTFLLDLDDDLIEEVSFEESNIIEID